MISKKPFEALYAATNHREFVHPDPLEFLYRYDNPRDQEVVGLVASALAYGNVKQILRSVSGVLEKMGESPTRFLNVVSEGDLKKIFENFYHRWHRGRHLAALLTAVKRTIRQFGSLEKVFLEDYSPSDETILPALSAFVSFLEKSGGPEVIEILPPPQRGSASKRLHMYLRWMIRKDDVDPGCWKGISPSKLVMPVDTHIHRICRKLRLTRRKQADLKTALEITKKFRRIVPDDPVRYDFALTRLGIREKGDIRILLRRFGIKIPSRPPLAKGGKRGFITTTAAKHTAESHRDGNIPVPPACRSG